ncbi:MAG: sulfatase-like hydrolase/transferase [Verrucomicrobia bacterium]|nr:sulfatase-like hydrolase/transferase [Verrucomicrobiota bacterium]MDA1006682.1 sulfatase-like hydrolase/transferase [Verrucomicrobiota bacterium]
MKLPLVPLLTTLALLALLPDRAAARQPNLILIMADDLGYRDLGCYGHPSIKTPVLDRLAAEGIRLTGFHSGATVCTPSRMALLTGAYPTRVGWEQGVVGFLMGKNDGMSSEALTIAEIFHSEGYATGISGKWHIGNQPDTAPMAQGFESAYFLTMSNNQTKQLWRGDEIAEDPFQNRLLTERLTVEAIRFVRANKERPFFLYLPYTAPHFPVQAHPDWKGKSGFGEYGDVVEEMDARIGDLLKTVAELGLEKDTLVVFCSDNGPNPGEKADSQPFRGEKWSALEGGTRVPCIVTWPGVIPAGQESDALFSAMDLLPTLCKACGIDWKSKTGGKPVIDGYDAWDTLLGEPGPHPRQELLFWQGRDAEPQAIQMGDWKLFFDRRNALEGVGTKRMTKEQAEKIAPYRVGLKAKGGNPPFLFNVRDDVGETLDLSGEYPEKIAEMQARAKAVMAGIKADGILAISSPGE